MFRAVRHETSRELLLLLERSRRIFAASAISLLILCAVDGASGGPPALASSISPDGDARDGARAEAAGRSWLSRAFGDDGRLSGVGADAVSWEVECKELSPFCGRVVDTIIVSGNTHTKSVTILRELATKQGSILDESLIRRDIGRLRGLGYFSEVRVTAEDAPGGCRLIVAISERPGLFMRVPYPVVNYDFKDGVSYGLTWKVKNFRGNGEDISLTALARRNQDQGGSLSWNIPWFTGRRMMLRFSVGGYRRLEEPEVDDFIKEQTMGGIAFGVPLTPSLVRQLWLIPSVSFERRYSRLTLPKRTQSPPGEFFRQDYVSFGADMTYDSRSDRLSPFDGMLHRFRARRYTSVSGPEQTYVLYGSSNCFYLPVGASRSFIFAVESNVWEGDVPTFYELGMGGVHDLRGFSDCDLRGTAKVVGTVQYRQRLFGPVVFRIPRIGNFDVAVNGIAFLDNGALARSIVDIPKSIFYSTGGLGVEVISPFRDVLRLEMASDGTGTPAFYVTAGSDF